MHIPLCRAARPRAVGLLPYSTGTVCTSVCEVLPLPPARPALYRPYLRYRCLYYVALGRHHLHRR